MQEQKGDIWRLVGIANAICVTTNGICKADGSLVMGRGIALDALKRYPNIAKNLGYKVRLLGNTVHVGAVDGDTSILSYPTKGDWRDPSDIFLIRKSAVKLVEYATKFNWTLVGLPRPGCGNGFLNWEDVKRVLSPIFDERFVVYNL